MPAIHQPPQQQCWYRFNPYGIEHSKIPVEPQFAPVVPPQPQPQPQHQFAVPAVTIEKPIRPVHSYLLRHLEAPQDGLSYLVLPSVVPRPAHWPAYPSIDGPFPDRRVFFGQCRYETTPEELAWILHAAAGLVPRFIVPHGKGCFVAHFFLSSEVDRALKLAQRVLFDKDGVWCCTAAPAGSEPLLRRYLSLVPTHVFSSARLPRGTMLVENFRSTLHPSVSNGPRLRRELLQAQQQQDDSQHFAGSQTAWSSFASASSSVRPPAAAWNFEPPTVPSRSLLTAKATTSSARSNASTDGLSDDAANGAADW